MTTIPAELNVKKKRKKKKTNEDLSDLFKSLEPYMEKLAVASMYKTKFYSLCVKASVVKCYEFNVAVQEIAKQSIGFFVMTSLRGISEDLIVLRFLKNLPFNDREKLIHALAQQELTTRVKYQSEFFSAVRPQQPVLRIENVENAVAQSAAVARSVWNQHGWPNLTRGALPPIRQIAEKQGVYYLATLYDYLYRLTSSGVHFSVQSLLRSGWGVGPQEITFSTKNFDGYFAKYCSIYGAFLFCLYFEFFSSILKPSVSEMRIVGKIREGVLFSPRWPEMVTFEEMNQKLPEGGQTMNMIVSALQAASRKRLISKGINYQNKHSAERRTMASLLKLLASASGKPRRKRIS